MRQLIRQGEGAEGYRRLAREHGEFRQRIEQALAQPVDSGTRTRATAGGDGRKLRGIPAVGRGVSGAISGTVPHNG